MIWLNVMMIGTFIFMGIVMAVTPYVSRGEYLFGVFIPEEFGKEKLPTDLKKKFAVSNLILSILFALPMIAFLFSGQEEEVLVNYMAIYGTGGILLYTGVAYGIYYAFHRKMRAFKATLPTEKIKDQKIVISTDFHKKPMTIPDSLFIGVNVVIILGMIVLPFLMYDRIPAQVPTHWGLEGVNQFSDKSIMLFLAQPVIALCILALMVVSNRGMKGAKQKVSPKNPQMSIEKNRAFRYAMSTFLFFTAVGTSVLFLAIQYMMVFAVESANILLIPVLIYLVLTIGATVYIMLKYGQGGERYTISSEGEQSLEPDESFDDDIFWYGGMFYFNRQDPSIWVEKRFGIGMTLNFARWQTWAIIVGIIAFSVGIVVFAT